MDSSVSYSAAAPLNFFHFRILALALIYGEAVLNWIIRPSVHFSYQDSSYNSRFVLRSMSCKISPTVVSRRFNNSG